MSEGIFCAEGTALALGSGLQGLGAPPVQPRGRPRKQACEPQVLRCLCLSLYTPNFSLLEAWEA